MISRILWTPSRIDSANYCLFRYYIEYILKKRAQTNTTLVSGNIIHKLNENFWDKLGKPEEIKINKKGKVVSEKKYSSQEQFVNYAAGQWWRAIILDEDMMKKSLKMPDCPEKRQIERRLIKWDEKFQGEKFVVLNRIKATARYLFPFLMNEGPPQFKGEIPYIFRVDGRKFKGRIDSLRIQGELPLVIDYKAGLKPIIKDMKLRFDPQPTCYCLAVSGLVAYFPEYAKLFHLEGEVESLRTGRMRISPLVQFEYWRMTPESPVIKSRTHRTDAQYMELVNMIEGTEADIKNGIIYPERGYKCDYCRVKDVCQKVSENPQQYSAKREMFEFIQAPMFTRTLADEPPVKQKTFRWDKRVKTPKVLTNVS